MRKLALAVAVVIVALGAFALALPSILHSLGLHPAYPGGSYDLAGKRALIITTSHGTLNAPGETKGEPTGVFASEMTVPYYAFQEAGMKVDVASIKGGKIPIDPQSFFFAVQTAADKRFKKDQVFREKTDNSLKIDDIDFTQYDIVYLAGGWGAAYDLGYSDVLGEKISDAYYTNRTIIGGVCHGPLGLIKARDRDGNLLIAGRRMTGVTDKQVEELGIDITPMHPETELRKAGAIYESQTAFRDIFATHVVIDDEKRFVTGQNQNSGAETADKMLSLLAAD
jgi:putative intracellular protease/amidase